MAIPGTTQFPIETSADQTGKDRPAATTLVRRSPGIHCPRDPQREGDAHTSPRPPGTCPSPDARAGHRRLSHPDPRRLHLLLRRGSLSAPRHCPGHGPANRRHLLRRRGGGSGIPRSRRCEGLWYGRSADQGCRRRDARDGGQQGIDDGRSADVVQHVGLLAHAISARQPDGGTPAYRPVAPRSSIGYAPTTAPNRANGRRHRWS